MNKTKKRKFVQIDEFFFKWFKQLLVYCQTWVVDSKLINQSADRINQSADISQTETLPKLPGWMNNVSTVWTCIGSTCLLWTYCFLWFLCPCVWKKRDGLTAVVTAPRSRNGSTPNSGRLQLREPTTWLIGGKSSYIINRESGGGICLSNANELQRKQKRRAADEGKSVDTWLNNTRKK